MKQSFGSGLEGNIEKYGFEMLDVPSGAIGGYIFRRVSRGRSAQAIVLFVFVLPAVIGAMGLAVDVGSYYLNYMKLQTAADAAVLSGVIYLPDQPSNAISTASNYATNYNGIAANEITSTTTSYDSTLCPAPRVPPPPPVPGCKLTMVVHRTVPFYFARMVNVNSGPLNVTAIASAARPANAINQGALPIGVQYTAGYTDGTPVQLRLQRSSAVGSGWASWWGIMLGGVSFTSNMPNGYGGKVSINDSAAPDPSLSPGPSDLSIQALINSGKAVDPSGTYAQHTANDARQTTVALVDWGAGRSCCTIKSFAQLWIDSVSVSNGTITIISGHWIANGVNGIPDTTGTALREGALAITLTQ